MEEINTSKKADIKDLILTIRGIQVLLDSDVAMLYGYEKRSINQAVSRNKKRFPERFCFQLEKEETDRVLSIREKILTAYSMENLKSQNVISSSNQHGGRRKFPYVFTEQGIAMLSGVLKNETAINVSIGIMDAFVEMRRFISTYGNAFERISTVEYKLIEHDKKFDEVFDLIQKPQELEQGIFYKGQIYDAFKLIIDIIHSAEKSIIIIDNYSDDSVLKMLTDKKPNVAVSIVTDKPSRITQLAIDKFNAQYSCLQVLKSEDFHDRFIIIDDSKLYHVGASLKDAGKKCFAISVLDKEDFLNSIINAVLKK